MPDKPKTRRLFFALWPDDETRRQIAQHIIPHLHNLNGRKVSQHQWHITLAFLGNVSDEMAACVQQQAQQVAASSFELTLDTIDHWSRPKVVWLGCHDLPETLQILVSDLNTALKPCDYEPEYPEFKAHMTLMRKVTRKPKPFSLQPITLHIEQFVLVESQLDNTGSTYNIINQWSLR